MPEHLRYMGTLGLLAQCAVYVPEDIRECIEQALEAAHAAYPFITWRRVLDRIDLTVSMD